MEVSDKDTYRVVIHTTTGNAVMSSDAHFTAEEKLQSLDFFKELLSDDNDGQINFILGDETWVVVPLRNIDYVELARCAPSFNR